MIYPVTASALILDVTATNTDTTYSHILQVVDGNFLPTYQCNPTLGAWGGYALSYMSLPKYVNGTPVVTNQQRVIWPTRHWICQRCR